jgi:membrane protein implicated in regulation of membrane protease activity
MDWLVIVCGILLIVAGVLRLTVGRRARPPAGAGDRPIQPYVWLVLGMFFIAFELLGGFSLL